MAFKKLLIATDFSEIATRALLRGIEIARFADASVVLLHVVENTWYPGTFGVGPMPLPDFEMQIKGAARERMETLRKEFVPQGMSCRTLLSDGVPWSEIVRTARDEKVDLIVVATHGFTGLKHALLGSQAERVVRHAPCPVLTVPADKVAPGS
jgi:universal stress protein A